MGHRSMRIGTIPMAAALISLGGASASAGTVFGTVVDNPSFRPLAGAWVYLAGRPAVDSLQTDSTGAFLFSGVEDCGTACSVRVRMQGYWPYASALFALGADQNLRMDVELELVHFLTVRAVKAEDTGQTLLSAHAVMYSSENEAPRCEAADSAGRMQFDDLQSFTAYLLTVSAPGRKATSNNLRFHGPPARGFWRVVLEADTAGSGKSVHGTLSAKDGGAFPGARVVLSCRNERIAADLFGDAGPDGAYAIEGVPAGCDSALLYVGNDTLAIALDGEDTREDWAIAVQRTSALRPARSRPSLRANRKRVFDLIGRKLKTRPSASGR